MLCQLTLAEEVLSTGSVRSGISSLSSLALICPLAAQELDPNGMALIVGRAVALRYPRDSSACLRVGCFVACSSDLCERKRAALGLLARWGRVMAAGPSRKRALDSQVTQATLCSCCRQCTCMPPTVLGQRADGPDRAGPLVGRGGGTVQRRR